jgi:ankyrin repeat protein
MWAAGHSNDVPDSDGLRTVELLLSGGARLDDADNRGRTALMIAAELGHGAIISRARPHLRVYIRGRLLTLITLSRLLLEEP